MRLDSDSTIFFFIFIGGALKSHLRKPERDGLRSCAVWPQECDPRDKHCGFVDCDGQCFTYNTRDLDPEHGLTDDLQKGCYTMAEADYYCHDESVCEGFESMVTTLLGGEVLRCEHHCCNTDNCNQ